MRPNLAILVVLAIWLAAVPGCGRVYRFEGIVVDGDGRPISDASIYLFPYDWERPAFGSANGTTGDDGSFEAGWGSAVGVKFFRMVVCKAGYNEHQQLVETDAEALRVVLERMPTVADSEVAVDP